MNTDPTIRWAAKGQATDAPGWSVAWAQIVGTRHASVSEDSVAHKTFSAADGKSGICLAVADGVGSGSRGDIASAALAHHCVNVPPELIGDAKRIAQWLQLAEAEVQHKLREVSFQPGASTMAAVWLAPDGTGWLCRVGDARVGLYDPSAGLRADSPRMRHLTVDQTYAFVGEEPPQGAGLEDPARMVGTDSMGEPQVQRLQVQPGQTVLLYSDGLHQGLDSLQIAEILDALGSDTEAAARELVTSARRNGSTDDITVLCARWEPSEANRSIGIGPADRWRLARVLKSLLGAR